MKSRKVKAYNKNSNIRRKPKVDVAIKESDDSDVDPDTFYHDEIDDFNNEKDNELSTDDELIQKRNDFSEEEEVLPITDDEKDESEEDDGEDDYDLPNREAWGKKKSMYYSADFVDQDRGRTYREEDAEAAKAEEEEAIAIQKSVYSNINADNLGAHLFFESDEESPEEEEVVKDSATKQEILKYLKKETKIFEYKALWESSIQKLKRFLRLWHLIETGQIKSKQLQQYIGVKKQILCLIIHNIHMYYMLASTGKNPKFHPVNQRIAQFKQFLDDLEAADHVLSPAIDQILETDSRNEEININSEMEEDTANELSGQSVPKDPMENPDGNRKSKKSKVKHIETENEKEVMSLISEVKAEMRKRKLEEMSKDDDNDQSDDDDDEAVANQDENNTDEKRMINYQIAKNKGLVPHRKKEYRNPRVRHRMKYRKAQIRRKGQVRNVIKEVKRYEGEPTGINANVVKSIKFK